MEIKVIARVNNVDLLCTKNEEYFIVDNLCKAIGVDLQTHLKYVKEKTRLESLLESGTINIPGGSEIEVFVIKMGYAIGWVFLFKEIEKEENEVIIKNIRKCHKAISEYVILRKKRISKLLEQENNLLREKLILQDKKAILQDEISGKDTEIESIKMEIYDMENATIEY